MYTCLSSKFDFFFLTLFHIVIVEGPNICKYGLHVGQGGSEQLADAIFYQKGDTIVGSQLF